MVRLYQLVRGQDKERTGTHRAASAADSQTGLARKAEGDVETVKSERDPFLEQMLLEIEMGKIEILD